jgi:hypothetical protein
MSGTHPPSVKTAKVSRAPETGGAARLLSAVAAGTILGFVISFCRPLIGKARDILKPYLLPLPPHALAQTLLAALLLLVLCFLGRLPAKGWRSLKVRLIPLQDWVWVPSVATFWVAYDLHRTPA